jgi:hypothetical protein
LLQHKSNIINTILYCHCIIHYKKIKKHQSLVPSYKSQLQNRP